MQQSTPIRFPVLRPLLPTADKLLPYIERIDASRWYTNMGPLLREFEAGLARHFHVTPDRVVTSSNATMALSQTLRALATGGNCCVMPSWTFVATPAAAVWAGFEPYFIDVDPESWVIMPEQILHAAKKRRVDSVIVTAAFGNGLDLSVWDRFTADTGIPVVVDAAAGFDGFARIGQQAASTPVVVSLHATKVSGIGEGAVVITGTPELAERIRRLGNFGFHGSRDATSVGTNAKMSEYSAAIGLAFLEEWECRRAGWVDLSQHFAAEASSISEIRLAPDFGAEWVSSYGLVEFSENFLADRIAVLLRRDGVETRKWWSEGCHRQSAYSHCQSDPLPVTERLGRQVLGLPFWLGLSKPDLTAIFASLRLALQNT